MQSSKILGASSPFNTNPLPESSDKHVKTRKSGFSGNDSFLEAALTHTVKPVWFNMKKPNLFEVHRDLFISLSTLLSNKILKANVK